MDQKEKNKFFVDNGWNKQDVLKIWDFGPNYLGSNVLVDQTSAIQYMNDIQDSFKSAF